MDDRGSRDKIDVLRFTNWASYKVTEDDGAWYEPGDADFDIQHTEKGKRLRRREIVKQLKTTPEKQQLYAEKPELLWRDVSQRFPQPIGPYVVDVVSPKQSRELSSLQQRFELREGFGFRVHGVSLDFQRGRYREPMTAAVRKEQEKAQELFNPPVQRTVAQNTILEKDHMEIFFDLEDQGVVDALVESVRGRPMPAKKSVDYGRRVTPTHAGSTIRALDLNTYCLSGFMEARMHAAQHAYRVMKFSHQMACHSHGFDDLDIYWQSRDVQAISPQYLRRLDVQQGQEAGDKVRVLMAPGLVRELSPQSLAGQLEFKRLLRAGDQHHLTSDGRHVRVSQLKDFVENNSCWSVARSKLEVMQDLLDENEKFSQDAECHWEFQSKEFDEDQAVVEHEMARILTSWTEKSLAGRFGRNRGDPRASFENNEDVKLQMLRSVAEKIHFYRQVSMTGRVRPHFSIDFEEYKKKEKERLLAGLETVRVEGHELLLGEDPKAHLRIGQAREKHL